MNMQALSQPQAPAVEAMLSREELAAVRAQMQHALHDPEEGFVAFWEAHGVDREHGGFLCALADDGTLVSEEKFAWYLARGV